MKKNVPLRIELFEKGMTITELAKKSRVPRPYISMTLHGRMLLEPEQERRIAEALGCETKRLFGNN